MRKSGPERREEIIDAAVAVFLAKGLAATTTRDVTGALGVGAGLLSHYFAWSELRALAFERLVRTDLQLGLDARDDEPARRVIEDLIATAFTADADAVWRVWIEASDLASGDAALAECVAACTGQWREGLSRLLARGNEEGAWRCNDPDGAGWRLLALFDGLVGLVMMPGAKLDRHAATSHLATAIGHECNIEPPC